MQRTISGTGLKNLKGELIVSGKVYANPVGVLPGSASTMLVGGRESYDITNGDFSGSITGGAVYEFEATEFIGTHESAIVPKFRASVTTDAGDLEFWELRLLGTGPYIPPPSLPVGEGGGDMLKEVYDTDDDGIVGQAEQVEWAGVLNKQNATTLAAGLMAAADKSKLDGVAAGATQNATDAALRDRATHTGTQAQSTVTGLEAALTAKADLVGGKLVTSQLPALAINKIDTVASQAAMLALVSERGDVAVRSDTGRTWILATDDPTQLANWVELPAGVSVTSVNGQTGVVNLNAVDVGAADELHTHDAADITTGTLDQDRLPAGLGASAEQLEHFRRRAAIMEPRNLRVQQGFEVYTVPDDETHWHIVSWNLYAVGHGAPARFESRNTTGGPLPMRGIALGGQDRTSMGYWVNPTDTVYADPQREYYRKMGIIETLKTRYRKNVSSVLNVVQLMPGPNGSVLLWAMTFDRAWNAYQMELGDWAGVTNLPAPDDRVHQEHRLTNHMLVPATIETASRMGGGAGFDWGNPQTIITTPMNAICLVNLPASYHGITGDRFAPNGYVEYTDSVDVAAPGTLPANITVIDPSTGGVIVHPDNEWLWTTAGAVDFATGWHSNTDRDLVATAGMGWEYIQDNATHRSIIGMGQGTGIARADFTHAIEIDNGVIKVLHNPGTGQVSRTVVGHTLQTGKSYRFRITLGAGGRAFYEMQTNYDDADRTIHPIGSLLWYDLLEGTHPGTGAGFDNLRMKLSVGGDGTSNLVAAPRMFQAHGGSPTRPGYTLWDDFVGLPGTNVDERVPNNAQQGTNKWNVPNASTFWKLAPNANGPMSEGAHHELGAAGQIIEYNTGVANGENEWEWTNPTADNHYGYLQFNFNAGATQGWWVIVNPALAYVELKATDSSTDLFKGVDGTAWPGASPILGAGRHHVRARVLDGVIQVWLNDVLVFDVDIPARPVQGNTYVGINWFDDVNARLHDIRSRPSI